MIRALILSPDPRRIGGVASFAQALKDHFTSNVVADSLYIGRRIGRHAGIAQIVFPFVDGWRIVRRMRAQKYDVVHINPSLVPKSLLRDGLFVLVVSRLLGFGNVIVNFHGWDPQVASRIRVNPLLRRVFRFVFGPVARILVMGRTFKDELESLGFETGMIEVVTALFDGREFRQAKGFPAKTGNTIVFMSRLIREKGVYELLDAFQEIHRRLPTARLVIIGDGPEKNRMEEVVRLVGLTEFVSFTGFLEGSTKTKYLDAADLFVLPSYQEGCPVAMLEAMAAGAAVVASAVGGVPDIVKDGINGILLKTVHPQAISDACIRLLNDRARCRTLGEGNAETAWKKYEAKAVAARFEQIYLRSTAGSTRCTATPA